MSSEMEVGMVDIVMLVLNRIIAGKNASKITNMTIKTTFKF